MAALEILSVSTRDEAHEQLWNSNIDRPAAGDEDGQFILHIAAWALGRSAPAVAVELVCDGRVLAVAPLRMPRPDLSLAYPEVPEAGLCGMAVDVDTRELPDEFEIVLRVLLQDDERVAIGSIAGRRADPSEVSEGVPAPTLHEDVRALVEKVAGELVQAPETGGEVLDRLSLAGEKVLTIGAGTGETSRAARARGAAIVDSYEPDAEAVRIARLLNAYHHTTRVSFYHRAIDSPDAYAEHYGVVLALSVFDRIAPVLGRVAEITDGVFVGKVADLEQGRALLAKHFEYQETFGDHIVAAAHTREALASKLPSVVPTTP